MYSTEVDTVRLQIDCINAIDQKHIVESLYSFFLGQGKFKVSYKDFNIDNAGLNKRVHFIQSRGTTIATYTTASYPTVNFNGKFTGNKYYISIKFAGLKTYNTELDNVSNECLLRLCAYFNTHAIKFKLTELDICTDIKSKFENILVICTRKVPRTKYYELNKKQLYEDTFWIERIDSKKRHSAILRSYFYDKGHKYKESFNRTLPFELTRFELKLQTRYFSKYGIDIDSLRKVLGRYHIMYFENLTKKQNVIDSYSTYKTIRKREIKRLELEKYRIYADIDFIDDFIDTLFSVDQYDIDDGFFLFDIDR